MRKEHKKEDPHTSRAWKRMRIISVRKNVPEKRLRFTSRFTAMGELLDVRGDQTLDTPSGFDTSGSVSSASANPNDSSQSVSFQAAV